MVSLVRNDDADIDAMLGSTMSQVGESRIVVEASAKLNAMLDAAKGAAKALVDPRTLPVRFSRLKWFSRSAAHYQWSAQSEWPRSLALRMGSGVHAGLFLDKPLVCYDGIRNGKAWKAFEARHTELDAVILNAKEYATAVGIVASVRRHERAMSLLFDGTTIEHRFDWSSGGRACSSTPDAYVAGVRNTDLKSTRTAEPRRFMRDAVERHYHSQLYFYDDAIEAYTGKRPADSFIVAVENVAPFPVVVLRMPAETQEVGAKLCGLWWAQLRAAELANYYAGYVESDIELEIPQYGHEPVVVEADGELITID